jgi:hypothetical protein
MHESRTGLWRLWPVARRKIPEGAKIHKSVLARIKAMPDYAPPLPAHYVEVE